MLESQDQFVARRTARWHELDLLLSRTKELRKLDGALISRVASLYRSVCSDLMRCRSAGYTPDLQSYLNTLTGQAHNALYGSRPFRLPAFVRFVLVDFPVTLRKNIKFFIVSFILFFAPLAVGVFGAVHSTDFAVQVLPPEALQGMVDAYSQGFDQGRGEGTDTGMAGFYVYNNISIAFRCFATGILFGVGSIFFLVYNGLVIGTVTGYVIASGHGANILTFMCGHGPFELTAIIISGGAGLQMGYALVDTKGLTRLGSLRAQAREIAQLIMGAALMLVIAAVVEAYWSPSALPPPVKWFASAVFTLLVVLYITLVGRKRAPR